MRASGGPHRHVPAARASPDPPRRPQPPVNTERTASTRPANRRSSPHRLPAAQPGRIRQTHYQPPSPPTPTRSPPPHRPPQQPITHNTASPATSCTATDADVSTTDHPARAPPEPEHAPPARPRTTSDRPAPGRQRRSTSSASALPYPRSSHRTPLARLRQETTGGPSLPKTRHGHGADQHPQPTPANRNKIGTLNDGDPALRRQPNAAKHSYGVCSGDAVGK